MMELYNAPVSTCSQKVRMALFEKELPWTDKTIQFARRDHLSDWYLALNPNGVVPTLVHDGHIIIDSSVINEYLEDVFPERPLRPAGAAVYRRGSDTRCSISIIQCGVCSYLGRYDRRGASRACRAASVAQAFLSEDGPHRLLPGGDRFSFGATAAVRRAHGAFVRTDALAGFRSVYPGGYQHHADHRADG
jgi:glutathione S-transferase